MSPLLYDSSGNKFDIFKITDISVGLRCLECNNKISELFTEECKENKVYFLKRHTIALYYHLGFLRTNEQLIMNIM